MGVNGPVAGGLAFVMQAVEQAIPRKHTARAGGHEAEQAICLRQKAQRYKKSNSWASHGIRSFRVGRVRRGGTIMIYKIIGHGAPSPDQVAGSLITTMIRVAIPKFSQPLR